MVKIKYPDAYELFKTDLRTARQFAELAQPEQLPVMDEFEKQYMTEFDFKNEGDAMNEIRRNLKNKFPSIVVPEPILCNSDIIIMVRVN